MQQIEFGAGEHISRAACRLVAAAQKYGEAKGQFNDIELTATKATIPQDITAYFDAECARRSEAYRASPEGISAAKRNQDEIEAMEAERDRLMAVLPTLDFSNQVDVLDWLCAIQVPSDRSGVAVDSKTVLDAFGGHGLIAGANCGKDFDGESRDNFYRYIVGQGLSGLKDGPAIHGIINKFTAEWKVKFGHD